MAPKERHEKSYNGEFPARPVVRPPHVHCHGPGFNPWSGNKDLQATWSDQKKKVTKNKIQKSLSNSSYCLVCSKVFYCNSFEIEAANVSKWQTVESQYCLLFKKKPTLLY